jgi:hypothetical protein
MAMLAASQHPPPAAAVRKPSKEALLFNPVIEQLFGASGDSLLLADQVLSPTCPPSLTFGFVAERLQEKCPAFRRLFSATADGRRTICKVLKKKIVL